jgi:hypothetical protein
MAAIADAAKKTTKDYTAYNPLPSAIEGPASSNPAPTNSTTSAAFTCNTNSTAVSPLTNDKKHLIEYAATHESRTFADLLSMLYCHT